MPVGRLKGAASIMSELTAEQVRNMSAADTARFFREAARRQREHIAITWE